MTEAQEQELLARLEALESELQEARSDIRGMENSLDYLDNQVIDLNDRDQRSADRVERAVIDISGVNLAERLNATAQGLLRDGYTPAPQPAADTAFFARDSFRQQYPAAIQWDTVQPVWSDSGTISGLDLPADDGTGEVAESDEFDDVPDDGAEPSETASPDRS